MPETKKVILLIETGRAFGRELLRGISKYSRLFGPWTFYRNNPIIGFNIDHLKNWKADGLIAVEQKNMQQIINMGIPTVVSGFFDIDLPHIGQVVGDVDQIELRGFQHLKACGFTNFAFYGFGDAVGDSRGHAFVRELSRQGLKAFHYSFRDISSDKDLKSSYLMKMEWLSSLPKPIGIMACNDEYAREVVDLCAVAGISVPEQVAILGIDNDEYICDLSEPRISSVALDVENAGFEAAALLDKLMNGEETSNRQIIVSPTLVEKRKSTDIIAINDDEVVKAMKFIRTHSKSNISVNDVVDSTCLSRRVLERRFKALFGRTILEEIRRVRVDEIVWSLLNTNRQIRRIALDLGYSSVDHISRYFKSEKGMSLLEFRKKYASK